MIFLLLYIFKVSVCIVILFGVYYLLLRPHTFHALNRISLVSILLFSFLVPLTPITKPGYHVMTLELELADSHIRDTNHSAEKHDNKHTGDLTSMLMILTVAYFLGILFFSYRFVHAMVRLYKIARASAVEVLNGTRIRRTQLGTSFTFLNTIFLPDRERNPIILLHEKAHVEQFHWIDLLMAEIASIVLWFNPVMILFKYELRLQHEYFADRSVIARGVSFEAYAGCLMAHLNAPDLHMQTISALNSSSTKKRIFMMTKKKTHTAMFLLYGVMFVTAAFVLTAFGKREIMSSVANHEQEAVHVKNAPDIAPVDLAKVTKIVYYGDRIHPIFQEKRKHTGVDFELSVGSDVIATADGVVVIQRYGEAAGNVVRIKHDEVYDSRYYHLERALVKVGEKVKKGQVIGLVGNTGLSKTPHLHYEVLKDDVAVDPEDYLPFLPKL